MDNKLFDYLRTLDPSEHNRFLEMLRASFFVKSKTRLYHLAKFLLGFHPDYNSPGLNYDACHRKLRPGKIRRSNAQVITAFHHLTDFVQRFQMLDYLERHENEQERLLYRTLDDRKLYDEYRKVITDRIESTREVEFPETDWYLNRYEDTMHRYYSPSTNPYDETDADMSVLGPQLEEGYALARLELEHELQQRREIKDGEEPTPLAAEVRRLMDRHRDSPNSILRILVASIELNRSDDPLPTYYRLRDIFYECTPCPTPTHKRLYIYFINAIIHIERSGAIPKYPTLVDLHLFGLRHDYLLERGKLTEITYINAVVLSAASDPVALREITENYRNHIVGKHVEETLTLSDAYVLFSQHRYEEVINLLEQHHLRHPDINRRGRLLVIRSWYEQCRRGAAGAEGLFDSRIKSLRRYFSRAGSGRVSLLQGNLNFLSLIRRLQTVQRKGANAESLRRLEEDIRETKPLSLREWLLKKVTELQTEKSAD